MLAFLTPRKLWSNDLGATDAWVLVLVCRRCMLALHSGRGTDENNTGCIRERCGLCMLACVCEEGLMRRCIDACLLFKRVCVVGGNAYLLSMDGGRGGRRCVVLLACVVYLHAYVLESFQCGQKRVLLGSGNDDLCVMVHTCVCWWKKHVCIDHFSLDGERIDGFSETHKRDIHILPTA